MSTITARTGQKPAQSITARPAALEPVTLEISADLRRVIDAAAAFSGKKPEDLIREAIARQEHAAGTWSVPVPPADLETLRAIAPKSAAARWLLAGLEACDGSPGTFHLRPLPLWAAATTPDAGEMLSLLSRSTARALREIEPAL